MQKLSNIKVIFTDIDGTLTNSDRVVPQKNKEAIKKAVEQGIMVVLCSGRHYNYAEDKAKDACASTYLITNNGAQIYDFKNHKSIFENDISKDIVAQLLEKFNKKNIHYILNTTNTRFGSKGLVRKLDDGEKYLESIDDLEDEKILQIVAEADSFEEMDFIVNAVDNYKDNLIILNLSRAYVEKSATQNNFYADVNKLGVNKGDGIKEFLKIFNIKKEETICFGDFVNDKEMFEACGTKVAMQNASKEIKDMADYITLSNNESGVGYFIENYILRSIK